MPNINQLITLNRRLNSLLKTSPSRKIANKLLHENELKKEAGFDVDNMIEHFNLSNFSAEKFKSYLKKFFESGRSSDVALLFIDIFNFSKKIIHFPNKLINLYLDTFYKTAFPIISSNGGQIEKLMGDGIICVFGEPFIKTDEYGKFILAEKCAKELIEEFYGTKKEVKVALHNGTIKYYKTPGIYEEFTMIGKPITELYRLESVSENNSINFYSGSDYDKYFNPYKSNSLSSLDPDVFLGYKKRVNLQGVIYNQINYLQLC